MTAGRPIADASLALARILEGTAASTGGPAFLATLVRALAEALGTHGALVTEYDRERRRLKALAFWAGGRYVDGYEYDIRDTPCEPVVEDARLVHIRERVLEMFPRDTDLRELGATSYLGVPLFDLEGTVLGHLAVIDTRPIDEDRRCLAVFQIFAARAAAELRQQRLQSSMQARDARIASLSQETAALREELRAHAAAGEIIGRSDPIERVRREIHQVADTDASVLVIGETGTGKELVARAIHTASRRAERPLVTVNCAAIPAALMESEFFGHERGAFTGAVQRREGRFAAAHTGTLFLDEIGELPRDMQAKFLRVLQEGEFEPVGSTRSRRIDIRIVAATNRDLEREVREGRFREDLFYRLNVFPLHVPPLRQRGSDVGLLAGIFAARCARRVGRTVRPLTPVALRRLMAYEWPGNVRELQNVIERAVIISQDGELDFSTMLPEVREEVREEVRAVAAPAGASGPRVLTVSELLEIERTNLIKALEQAAWKIAGDRGAASLLNVKPSTLASRMKALGIRRPQ